MIACSAFMSKRCLSSHHKRLSVYISAAMHIKKKYRSISCDWKHLYVSLFGHVKRKVSSIIFFCKMMGLVWILIMGYEFENRKDFGSVILHKERPHAQFRLNGTCFVYILNCFARYYTHTVTMRKLCSFQSNLIYDL